MNPVSGMNQNQNYYVIVGRDGTRAVAHWLPAPVIPVIGRDTHCCYRDQEGESSTFQMVQRCGLAHETKS